METELRVCIDCGEAKPPSSYYGDRTRPDGLHPYCRSCHRARRKPTTKNDVLRRTYGITLADWEKLHDEQGGKCRLCHLETFDLFVDHCHATGVIRGLLCSSCNTGLGHFRDDPALLRRAADYADGSHANFTPAPQPPKRHPGCKLTLALERELVSKFKAGRRAPDLAVDYGISRPGVHAIVRAHIGKVSLLPVHPSGKRYARCALTLERELEAWTTYQAGGVTIAELATLYDVSYSSMRVAIAHHRSLLLEGSSQVAGDSLLGRANDLQQCPL